MDVADRVRPASDEQIVVAAHLAVPGVEARAAKASSSSLSAWIIVPMAPSSTRMRSARASIAEQQFGAGLIGTGRGSAALLRSQACTVRLARRSAADPADGRSRRRGRRGSWCRSGSR